MMERETSEKPDSMLVAVIAMNIATFSATGMSASYRIIANEGFHPAELNLMRNALTFLVSLIWCYFTGLNPLKEFPLDKKMPLLWRILFGQGSFLLTNIAAALLPLSLMMICR